MTTARTLAELLADAATRVERLQPADALAAMQAGALLVDLRSDSDRERDGVVPGSLHVPRTLLEWRFAPDSEWRTPVAPTPDQQIVLLCDHGCSSLLAASALADLGCTRVGDVAGGFEAWSEAGLPTMPAPPRRAPGELPGMGPPDELLV